MSFVFNLRLKTNNSFDYRVNFLCFGLQPAWFHATNVALHALACVLFTRVCVYIAGLKQPFATAAGLMFATHPVHTEAVSVPLIYCDFFFWLWQLGNTRKKIFFSLKTCLFPLQILLLENWHRSL